MRLIDADELLREIKRRSDQAAEARMALSEGDIIALVDDAETVKVPRWTPVTPRTMPEDYKKVLCRGADGFYCVMLYDYDKDGWKTGLFSDTVYGRKLVSHWMPLSMLPEVE